MPTIVTAHWAVPGVLLGLLALRTRTTRWVVWVLLGAAWTAFAASGRAQDRLSAELSGRDFDVTGWVASFPQWAPGQATFVFRVVDARARGLPSRVRLTWYDPPSALAAGDALHVSIRLRTPHGSVNPGGFDFERWLLVNNLGATGYVRRAEQGLPRDELAARWARYRANLASRIVAAVADEGDAALLVALALGERYRFSEQHWRDFRRTGTTHLVAVSGMHVALLGLLVFGAIRWLVLRLPSPLCFYDVEVAAASSLVATIYYAALTGFATPAQRSLVMIAVSLAVLVGRRRIGVLQSLALTLWAVLVWDPFAPLTASFWLSFGAVAILLALVAARRVRSRSLRRDRILEAARDFVGLQWRIGLALVPMTAWYFAEIPLLGPLVNLVAIPWFNVALMPLAVLVALCASLHGAIAWTEPLISGAGTLAGATGNVLHWLGEISFGTLRVGQPNWSAFALAGCGVAFAIGAPPMRARWLAWLTVVPMFAPRVAVPLRGEVRATVLDVGHGLAVIVATQRHRLLFDAGPALRSGYDAGASVVLPALAADGRRDLDRMIVSHADLDHAGGMQALLTEFPSLDVLTGPDVELVDAHPCRRGQTWVWDDVRFELLHPPPDFVPRGNESSCVLKVTAASGHALLIAADAERRAEAALVTQDLAADVIVVPHHGSATSSSPGFVSAVGASYAVVSAGFENRWGFPKPDVVDRWQTSGAQVVVTADAGAVQVWLGSDVALKGERDRRHRYWHAQSR